MRNVNPDDYFFSTVTVAGGVEDHEVDIDAELSTDENPRRYRGPATSLKVTTDVSVLVRLNKTTAPEIPVSSTDPLNIAAGSINIHKLYISHTGACGAGAASVQVLAI